VKPSAAIENYYFPFFTQPQEDTKKSLPDNKIRAKSLGKISFSYEDRQPK
jgi:hypothetical protein